jgi:hypothetical protein
MVGLSAIWVSALAIDSPATALSAAPANTRNAIAHQVYPTFLPSCLRGSACRRHTPTDLRANIRGRTLRPEPIIPINADTTA